MATTTFKETPVHTVGELPEVGTEAPDFLLVGTDLAEVSSADLRGRRVVLNIFPSVDTGVCAASVHRFNEIAAGLDNTTVVCASHDLPFALKRFCGAEGIEDVVSASGFRSSFGDDYGVRMLDGPLEGLLARAVVVVDTDGSVLHTQLVPAIGEEPDYDAAVEILGGAVSAEGSASSS
ncbi:thiol peroxidase [Ornithinimicrobium pratense]|uniref:Thiol peroxidase n=1 Tax=Ornithinimicrobium pratense TaxID=2593973 RepID=A0A5J6V4C7_9MICO|nr:thiol peroxidase [Ornithinimicrobium pratense]QFG68605.1 thiol peroxidase [Ornithinimicrobium pratense]